jgi:hypothetical protein
MGKYDRNTWEKHDSNMWEKYDRNMWKNHNNGDINIGKNRNYRNIWENTTGI